MDGGDKAVPRFVCFFLRRWARLHLPRRRAVSAQPTHLYVLAVIFCSHLERVASPSLHLNRTLSSCLCPELFAPFQRQWRESFPAVDALTENRVFIGKLMNKTNLECECVCVSESISPLNMTHTGLAHLSQSTDTHTHTRTHWQ